MDARSVRTPSPSRPPRFLLFIINFLLAPPSTGLVSKSPGCICTWMSVRCLITTWDALPLWKRRETHDTKQIGQINFDKTVGACIGIPRPSLFWWKKAFMFFASEESKTGGVWERWRADQRGDKVTARQRCGWQAVFQHRITSKSTARESLFDSILCHFYMLWTTDVT